MRNVQYAIIEVSRKRIERRGYVPAPDEWVAQQPELWRSACAVFAANVNTPGGITGKTINQMVATANAVGVRISVRTFKRRYPDLERYKVVRQERHVDHLPTGEIRRRPSTWLIRLRDRMPGAVSVDNQGVGAVEAGYEARNEAWLRETGWSKSIEAMLARVAAQREPPF